LRTLARESARLVDSGASTTTRRAATFTSSRHTALPVLGHELTHVGAIVIRETPGRSGRCSAREDAKCRCSGTDTPNGNGPEDAFRWPAPRAGTSTIFKYARPMMTYYESYTGQICGAFSNLSKHLTTRAFGACSWTLSRFLIEPFAAVCVPLVRFTTEPQLT